MDQAPNPEFLADITGALDWWRDAGVDLDLLDEPVEWLAEPGDDGEMRRRAAARRRAPVEEQVPAAPPGIDPAILPADLAEFTRWWMSEPLLDAGRTSARVPPQGKAGADVMILVETPESEDRETLLSGPQGRLLDAILAALETRRDEVYIASVLPRAVPAPDWTQLRTEGMGKVLLHHVGLVAPKRLFTFGENVLPLLGHELPRRTAISQNFNHEGRSIPLLASWGLASLLNHPSAKPVLWKTMLDWSAA
ncbi:hypothetical protein I5E68_07640 [Novosphingobium sp. YJ-S2-02]|uniref:Uracil-DNA glycosylase-like domain-containing protein n=1 Tax=Novosphingobium aureum TaxID=2792964 RepID=A0A931MKE1_9SPHN|nr:uracil-DNA glycosylase family protein [Novosphingobium aureum]MBH0112822.1 hypothetical protein [Novosphingobium aureum]